MKSSSIIGGCLPAAALCLQMTTAAAAESSVTRLYTDAQGVTHFREETIPFNPVGGAGREALSLHPVRGASGVTLLRLRAGAEEDWHTAPQRQFVIAIEGLVEVEASDGSRRVFVPGQIMLMDDTTGKGHITRSIGKSDHVAVMIPVADY